VLAGAVEDQRGDGTDADACADFGQMFVHGLDANCRHDQGGAGAARRADGAEHVGPSEPPVASDSRTRAALALRRPSIALRATEPFAGSAQMRVGVPWLSDPGGMRQGVRSAKRFGRAKGGFILT